MPKKAWIGLLMVGAAAALLGCSKEKPKPKIAFLLTLNNPYWDNMPIAAREEAARLGVEVTFYNANEDANVQIEQINEAIATGVDAACVVPMQYEALVNGIKLLNRAKIPVIIVNRRVAPGCDYVCYTGTDTYNGAVTSAEILMKAIGGEGGIVELHQTLGTDPEIQRTKALREVQKKHPKVTILARVPHDMDQGKAVQETQVLLDKHPALKGIYAHGDDFAIAAANACAQRGRKDVAIVGMGGSREAIEAIKAGKITGTSFQQPAEEGRMGIQLAVRALKGEKLEEEYLIPCPAITKENADKFRGQF